MHILWGVIIIACGVFITVYGSLLFRFALAVLGFGLGALLAWWLTGGQSEMTRILISLVVGGVAAGVLYALVRIGTYIAGGVLGLVLAFLLIAIIDLDNAVVDSVLVVAGTGVAGYFGPRLGRSIIALGTSAAGAFQVVYGLAMIFIGQFAPDATPLKLLGSPLALSIFLIVAAIGSLSQMRPRVGVVRTVK